MRPASPPLPQRRQHGQSRKRSSVFVFISIFIGVLVFRQRSSSHFQATRCQNSQGCAVRSDFGFSLLIANIIYGKFGKLTLAFSGGTSGRCLEPYVVLEVS